MVAQEEKLPGTVGDGGVYVTEAGRASPWAGQPRRLPLRQRGDLLFFDLNAERFQEFQILVVDLEFRVGGEGGDE